MPTLTETGTLPKGVTFKNNANGTATLAGTRATTGGTYPLTITAANGVGTPATQPFILTVDQAPSITSVATLGLTIGKAGTFKVATKGFPTSTIAETGSLPSGVTFVDNHNGTATLAGTPAAGTAGTYPLTITATNGIGTPASQSFTLTISQTTLITSANSVTFTAGTAGTFQVTTTGSPVPTLTETGTLPKGVTFKNNANGTATLAGTPAATAGGTYPLTITAANGVGTPATQPFTLTVDQAPSITSVATLGLTIGKAGTFKVATKGFPTSTIAETGSLPSGVTFVDNHNGTATLAGTPAAGTAGTYPLTITATNGIGTPASQSFTLTISQTTLITSANSVTFTAGTAGTFQVTTTGSPVPTLTETGTLPKGVTFKNNANGTATLAGTPAATTGGTYALTITATNGVGTPATQAFTLTVDQAPTITSAATLGLTIGKAGTFKVATKGFPTSTIAETGALPSGVTFVDNHNGTATLAGTPAAGTAGTYPLTITATNGIGTPASQSFALTVNQTTLITSADAVTFTAGTASTFQVTTAGSPVPTLTETGTLPKGVTFKNNANGTATLAGTPAATTGGTYALTITATNGIGTPATQAFTLTVDQAPTITSAANVSFSTGVPESFKVVVPGFPTSTIAETGALPSGVTFVDNHNGTATVAGTPTAGTAGSYPLTITATNGIGTPASQAFVFTAGTSPACSDTWTGSKSSSWSSASNWSASRVPLGTDWVCIPNGAGHLPVQITTAGTAQGSQMMEEWSSRTSSRLPVARVFRSLEGNSICPVDR